MADDSPSGLLERARARVRRLALRRPDRIPAVRPDELVRASALLESRVLVFVGGLHRSGTTLLGRLLAQHDDVAGLRDTGVYADEGQHVQRVWRSDLAYGGVGRFATAPGVGRTEASPLVRRRTAVELLAYWSRHWDVSRPVLVEKSPFNMLRFRLLQALFPGSLMLLLKRHPVAVTYASQKWSKTSTRSLLEHWLTAHDRFEQDRPHVDRLQVLTYEDLVADPDSTLAPVFTALDLASPVLDHEVREGVNARYLQRWQDDESVDESWLRTLRPRVRRHGYELPPQG